MHNDYCSRQCTVYLCSRCNREISELGGCDMCKHVMSNFPWHKVLRGPAVVSFVMLGAIMFLSQKAR
jgi:hypothetical protein